MFKIKIDGLDKVERALDDMGKQVAFATSVALNRTAVAARDAGRDEMRHVFDRPTPFVLRGLGAQMSTKRDLRARIGYGLQSKQVKDGASAVLPNVDGGSRGSKSAEKKLRALGVLAADEYIEPSRNAKLNQYGNVSKTWMNKMLADLGSHGNTGKKAQFFVGKFGKHQQKMIARRVSRTHFIPFMIITKAPHYKKRFDFQGVVDQVVSRDFHANFSLAYQQALKTAKR